MTETYYDNSEDIERYGVSETVEAQPEDEEPLWLAQALDDINHGRVHDMDDILDELPPSPDEEEE